MCGGRGKRKRRIPSPPDHHFFSSPLHPPSSKTLFKICFSIVYKNVKDNIIVVVTNYFLSFVGGKFYWRCMHFVYSVMCVCACAYLREREREEKEQWNKHCLCLNILAVDHLMLTGNWNVDLCDIFVYLLFVVLHYVFCMLLTKWHETRFLKCLWRLVSRSDGVYYLWQHLHNGHSSRWLRRMYSLVHVLMYMFYSLNKNSYMVWIGLTFLACMC